VRTRIAIALVIALGGCSRTQQAVRGNRDAPPSDELRRYEAEFRPSDHDADSTAVAGSIPESGNRDADDRSRDAAPDAAGELVPGFRVQIFSTTSIDVAKAKKAEAEAMFPGEWIYMQYDPPAYKIRAGNFLQRFEADRFIRLAVEKGYTESWTVPEKVFKNPPSPRR
jgi:hypothetical protein